MFPNALVRDWMPAGTVLMVDSGIRIPEHFNNPLEVKEFVDELIQNGNIYMITGIKEEPDLNC